MGMYKLLLILLLPAFSLAQTPMSKLLRKFPVASCSDADATKYFVATGISNPTIQNAICNFVTREKAASRWGTEVQAFYILANGSFASSKYNLIDTTLYTLTTTGTITYTTGSGGGADPTSGAYLTTNYTPSTHGNLNSLHLMFYSQENVNEVSIDMGAQDPSYYTDLLLLSNTLYGRVNVDASGDFISGGLANTLGFFLSNRTSSTAVAIYQNSTSVNTGSITADGLPTVSVNIFTSNGAFYSTKKAAFASIGAGVSNTTDYYNSVQQLKTDMGL